MQDALPSFSIFQLENNERWYVSLGPSAGVGSKIDVKEFATQAEAEAFAEAERAKQAAERRVVPAYSHIVKLQGGAFGVNLIDFVVGEFNIPTKAFSTLEEAQQFSRDCIGQPQADSEVRRTHLATFNMARR